jgi:AmmeMemoRadiSam system protein A
MPAWEDPMDQRDPQAEKTATAELPPDSEPHPLEHLLDLARAAVFAAVDGRPAPAPDPGAHPEMSEPSDAFVTLTAGGDLRGCMGTLGAEMPVGEAVVRAAGLAATRDPRFPPVAARELAGLRIEVSVLTRPLPLASPEAFVPGRDGIVVEAHGRRALLLPQVATEMGWGATQMLDAVCEKAGLHVKAWRQRGTRLEVFEVARVSGPA